MHYVYINVVLSWHRRKSVLYFSSMICNFGRFTLHKELFLCKLEGVGRCGANESAYQKEAAICQCRHQTAGGKDARCLNKDWQDGRWQETDFLSLLALLLETRLTIRVLWCRAGSRCWFSSLIFLPSFYRFVFSPSSFNAIVRRVVCWLHCCLISSF